MGLQPEPFEKIQAGTKKIELRLFDEKRRSLNIGDIIEFQKQPNETGTLRVRVTALLRYESFSQLFDDFPSEVFGGKDKASLLDGVHRFYSPEREKENGVLGIKIEPLEE